MATRAGATPASKHASITNVEAILTGRAKDAQRLFYQYDLDKDGLLSSDEVFAGLGSWGLNLSDEMFSQFVDCNFLYADRDLDGHLSLMEWTQLFKLMSEVLPAHQRCPRQRTL